MQSMIPKLNIFYSNLLMFGLFCFLTPYISAQNPNILKGYYSPSKGVKITGTLNITKWPDNILKFKPTGEKRWKKLKPADILEAGTEEGHTFLSHGIITQSDTTKILFRGWSMVDTACTKGKQKTIRRCFLSAFPIKKN